MEVEMEPGGRDKILVLDIDGAISSGPPTGDAFFGQEDSTVNQVAEKLSKARRDRSIKALIIRVDSPGGGVTASDVVYQTIADFKKETGIPVYVSMLDLAASGGYYVSMAADQIYAHPTSITGSIGVIAMFPQLEALGNKIGVRMEIVKSGQNKDIGSPFHEMTAEERAILQQLIDDMYDRFVEVVKSGRPALEEATIRQLADGRIYTANQALQSGLIDGIMYLPALTKFIRQEIGSRNARVVVYRKSSAEKFESLYAKASPPEVNARADGGSTNVGLVNIDARALLSPGAPVFQYLWVP